ncbi:MAG TPA: phosphoglycerate kinase [Acidimicrobiales bacterium]|jgi:phosphoglycerate kinase|nr:phosphoglycerate kinase [Acidimicrobiales bacterium]
MTAGDDNPILRGLPLLGDLPPLDGASVLVRVDFNVPLGVSERGTPTVTDDFRIRSALPTFRYLLERGAKVTAGTHLGRPDGAPDPRWEMTPVRDRLAELAPEVQLLDNLRFEPGECDNDPAFVDKLVNGHDAYVNDAFGVSHRAHASIVGPPRFLPSAAGLLVQRELEVLGGLLGLPARPFVAVVGGAKVTDKIGVLTKLLDRVDALLVGGGMAFTFLAAAGHDVGASMVDEDQIDRCAALLAGDTPILLPSDIVALEPGATFGCGCDQGQVVVVEDDVPAGWVGLDIGPATVQAYSRKIAGAGTVLWNGPMGVFEDDRFCAGTTGVAQAVAECRGFTVVGGGDSAAAVDAIGLADRIDFISTGGGASLELLEHGDLPGLAALRRAVNAPGHGTRRGRPSS